MERPAYREQDLENPHVIAAGGRGIARGAQVEMLEQTAALFKNAAVGASRGACDLGGLPHPRPIGETGRTVAPALYLACEISGAPQHLASMRGLAHHAVEEDGRTFLPLLREQ